MSASFTGTQISIFRRSFATRKSDGVLIDAVTVCPMFTRRSITTPSTVDRMSQ